MVKIQASAWARAKLIPSPAAPEKSLLIDKQASPGYFVALRASLTALFVVCVVVLVVRTWHWPLVNDPAQFSYLCFLMDHGMAPYRDIIEMNMPGTYLVNWTVMHALGAGSLAWRIFDLGLLGVGSAAMISIAWPYDWFAGVFSSALFILFHGRDGAEQMGQRDLIIAVLLLAGCAFLFRAIRGMGAARKDEGGAGKRRAIAALLMGLFGLCAGVATTIKPTPLPFALLLLLFAILVLRERRQPWALLAASAVAGMLVPLAVVLEFLMREHALHAFLQMERVMLPYYATLGRQSMGHLLEHALPPSLLAMALLAMAVVIAGCGSEEGNGNRIHQRLLAEGSWEQVVLGAGILFGVASYVAQGKGFAYHRYPAVGFLLCWAGIQFAMVLRSWERESRATLRSARGVRTVRWLGMAGLILGAVLAPVYLAKASRLKWNEQVTDMLQGDLTALGGPALSTHVQCLYTFSECDTALYRMRLVQSTGLFYDYFLFGPQTSPVVQSVQRRFSGEIQRDPPQVFVVLTGLYPDGVPGYGKLRLWPWFDNYLAANYSVYRERSGWTGDGMQLGYRIYVRKQQASR